MDPILKQLRWLHHPFASAIFLGIVASFLFVAPIPFIPLLALTPLLISRWILAEEGFLISSATVLVFLLLFAFPLLIIVFALFYEAPVWFLGRIAPEILPRSPASKRPKRSSASSETRHPESKIVGFYVVLAGAVAFGMLWLLSTIPGAEEKAAFFETLLSPIEKSQSDPLLKTFRVILPYMPALTGILWVSVFAFNLFLNQTLLKRLGFECFTWNSSRWTIKTWPYGVFAFALMGAVLGPTSEILLFSRNLLPALSIPFWIEGILVTNYLVKRLSKNDWIQRFLWAGLALLGWPLLMVLFLGFIEPWSRLRAQGRKRL